MLISHGQVTFKKFQNNTFKIKTYCSYCVLMTTNFNTNHQIMKMKTKVNCPKIAKETSSSSTSLFQRTSPATSVNVPFF